MQVFSGKQSWEEHPIEEKGVQSYCAECLEYSMYFGVAKTLGMRDE